MFATIKARQRHQKLMRAAHHLLREAWLNPDRNPADITAADVTAYAFGQYRIALDQEEAQLYLDAARVARGEATALPTA